MNAKIYTIGFWSGLIAFVALFLFFVVQSLQVLGVLHFPWDQILIFGFSLCIPLPFLIAMLALHYITPSEKKFWTHGALIFTTLYVAFVTANYVVQLATVIPTTMQGNEDDIKILMQTPHSLFWDFDAMGYIFMGLATLFALPAFERKGFQKWVRYSFLLHVATTPLICFVYFCPAFSNTLLPFAIPWAITALAAMLMLALFCKKNSVEANSAKPSRFTIVKAPKI